MSARLTAPYPYFGAKGPIAPRVWEAFGNPGNYVEPFFGSGAVLLARPTPGKVETANDASGFIPNLWRAIQHDPEAVAFHADWPVSEADLHARHAWLVDRLDAAFVEKLSSDPTFFDAQVAGWWVWGQCIWIGGGWCEGFATGQARRPRVGGRDGRPHHGTGIMRKNLPRKKPALCGNAGDTPSPKEGIGINRKLPRLVGAGNGSGQRSPAPGVGINRPQLPRLAGCDGTGVSYGAGINVRARREQLFEYFAALQARLRHVRFTCGDWSRVVTESVTISHGPTAVFLDPPYGERAGRKGRLYATDSLTVADEVARWAIEHGDDRRYRIALCGYEGEHEMPPNWRVVPWKSRSGYASSARERLYLSPHCLGSEVAPGPLFALG